MTAGTRSGRIRERGPGGLRLIIAEKPSVARAIAGVLGRPTRQEGFLAVGSDLVSWARGHLVSLAEPEAYQAEWRRWSWSGLPMLPEAFRLAPVPSGRDQLQVLARLVKRADVDRIVVATDADREGELIARWLLRHLKARQPALRLWLSETTPSAIRTALSRLQPASAYEHLGQAAEARAEADWLVGLNATRAITLRHGQRGQGALSVGRVQTPTLRLIADRDAEIQSFRATPYWQVEATFTTMATSEGETYRGLWIVPGQAEPADRIGDRAAAERVVGKVPPGTKGVVSRRESRRVTVHPPRLYNLADLQKDANRRFGMTAQDTLGAAQRLYEARLASYPRTDARAVSAVEAASMGQRLASLGALYGELASALPSPLPLGRITNNAEVDKAGHPAIVPTGERPGPSVSARDQKVWDLIVRRTFAALLPPGIDERTTVWTEAAGETFRTQGSLVVVPGWRVATTRLPAAQDPDAESEARERIPPGLSAGQAVEVSGLDLLEKTTKPPAHLTDATLLALMEKHGLGTPATRAGILDTLVRRAYVVRDRKALVSTAKGRALLQVAPPALQSPDLTGDWEAQLEAVAGGTGDAAAFVQSIRTYTADVVAAVREQPATVVAGPADGASAGAEPLGGCPVCHEGQVVATPKGWGCSRWKAGCSFTIWRTVAKKRLTDRQVTTLLGGKTTGVLKGFKNRAGQPFSARLRLEGGRVAFVFGGQTAAAPGQGDPGDPVGPKQAAPAPRRRPAGRPARARGARAPKTVGTRGGPA